MIYPSDFFEALACRGITRFFGVPDSLLASFCAYVDDHGVPGGHVIAANEGNAVAMAMGHHLASGEVAAVYMQNSGLGNAVNPLTSLIDPLVYRVPVLLIIGWRGEPGVRDEPQHLKQGEVTLAHLEILGIPYQVLDAQSDVAAVLDSAMASLRERGAPVALVFRKDTFSKYEGKRSIPTRSDLGREQALEILLGLCGRDDLIISTTGKTSRELFELRARRREPQRDFLTVGGMGHTSSIALGVALARPQRRVVCLDGDGSVIMHMGSLPVIAKAAPRNLVHVVLNNRAHESVGGQATAADFVDFRKLAAAVGYRRYARAVDTSSLHAAWREVARQDGPVLLELCIRCGSRDDLGRPTTTTEENKLAFMEAARA